MKTKELVKAFDGREVRVVVKNGVEWFVARDVCGILEIADHRDAIRNLNERYGKAGMDTKGMVSTHPLETSGGKQELLCVNETGLYELIFSSRKEEAVKFRRWICEEVLPSIRKTSKYDVRDIRDKSRQHCNMVTAQWQRQGVETPTEYARLTREEYLQLYGDRGKKKEGMDRQELLKLSAFEAVESWKLSEIGEGTLGFPGCRGSIRETAGLLEEVRKTALLGATA